MSKRIDFGRDWCFEARGLSIRRRGRIVLDGLDLRIGCRECVALIGPNGAGKTTLLLALLGLLPPARGSLLVAADGDTGPGGVETARIDARQRGRLCAYVPQIVDRIPAFSVRDVVAAGRYPHIRPLEPLGPADLHAIDAALAQCGLSQLAGQPVNEISGGERQKVLLAAALAQDAQLMLLDEPTTGLDPSYQIELVGLLRRWRDRGRGLILVSHDLALPAVLDARVIALRASGVVADGPSGDVLVPDVLERVFAAAFERVQTADGRAVVLPRWTS